MYLTPQSKLGVRQVRGPFSKYLNWNETSILVALVKSVNPEVMIEFGCNLGITSKRVLENVSSLGRYIGVDVLPTHVPELACQASEVPADAGVYAADDERFYLMLARQPLFPDQLEPCDAVFIDGDHSAKGVLHDTGLARSLVKPGGIIVWHDVGNPSVEVTPALDALFGQGWPIWRVDGSWLAFMRT